MKNYGFVPPQEITPDHFILGSSLSLPTIPLNESGDWTKYLPKGERQDIFIETFNCTSFGTLNCIEILLNYYHSLDKNFSDRYLGIMAGTKPPGNDPHKVAQAIRHNGLIPEDLLPFKDITSWQDYYSFKDADEKECRDKGQEFLQKWYVGHEWVSKDKLREGLKYSPLGISVTAWHKNDKGHYYSPKGQDNNHWTVLYKIDDEGYMYVKDSYEPFLKILTPDHNIQYAKRYNIGKVEDNLKLQISILQKVLSLIKQIYAKTIRVGGEIIKDIFSTKN